jgi:hypothetical protein
MQHLYSRRRIWVKRFQHDFGSIRISTRCLRVLILELPAGSLEPRWSYQKHDARFCRYLELRHWRLDTTWQPRRLCIQCMMNLARFRAMISNLLHRAQAIRAFNSRVLLLMCFFLMGVSLFVLTNSESLHILQHGTSEAFMVSFYCRGIHCWC